MLAFLRQLGRFALASRKLWVFPLVVFIVVLAGVLLFAQSSSVAPFIYAIF
mgnify:CR=1 FL=1